MTVAKTDIRIVRLSPADARGKSDHFMDFYSKIIESDSMYPGIQSWLREKVAPGIRSQERTAFVGYLNERPVVTAVVKQGVNAKICHLKIEPALRNTHLGDVFFSLLGIEMRPCARSVHFTLPASVWAEKHGFFESFGFDSTTEHSLQYRLFDPELRCEIPFSRMWSNVLAKLPKLAEAYSLGGFSLDSELLFSIRPEFARKIMRRDKTVELRRKFSTRWIGSRVSIYASDPIMGLIGEARITDVTPDKPADVWERFNASLGCSKQQYDEYTSGCTEVYAIELDDIRPYRDVVPAIWASQLLDCDLRPPQSYLTLANNKGWSNAVSLAAYFHGCFKSIPDGKQGFHQRPNGHPNISRATRSLQMQLAY